MRVFGLIGHPLSHSWSATFWNAAFERNGMSDCIYRNFDLSEISQFSQLIALHPEIEGLNITIPYKTSVIPLLDRIDPVAEAIGAVNTVKIVEGQTTGYNTDAEGFRRSIRPFLEPKHNRALVLGTGGAANAVNYVLRSLGIAVLRVSRSAEKGDLSYGSLNEAVVHGCKLIVNCTPVGMAGYPDESPITTKGIASDHLVVDLIYNPAETRLLSQAKANGATVLNGADMLRFQAEEAMRIFFGRAL